MAAVPHETSMTIHVDPGDLDKLRALVQSIAEGMARITEAAEIAADLTQALQSQVNDPLNVTAAEVPVLRCSRTDVHEDHLHYDRPASEPGEYRRPAWCDGNDPDVGEVAERVLKIPEGTTPDAVMADLLRKAVDQPLDTEILVGQPTPMPGAGKGPNASLVQGVGLVCPECAQGKRQNCTQVLADGVTRCAYAHPEPNQ